MSTLVTDIVSEIRFNIKRELAGFADSLILSRLNWSLESVSDLFNLDEMRELLVGNLHPTVNGVVTTTAATQLIDTPNAQFGVWNVGNKVYNDTTSEQGLITAFVGTTTLVVSGLSFTEGDSYTIYNNFVALPENFKSSQLIMLHDASLQIPVVRKMREDFSRSIVNPYLIGRPYIFSYDQLNGYFQVYKNPMQLYPFDMYYYKFPNKVIISDEVPFLRMDRLLIALTTVFCFYSLQEWDLGDKWGQIFNGLLQQLQQREKDKYNDVLFEAKGFLRGTYNRYITSDPAADPLINSYNS